MRARKQLVAATLALPALVGLAGCGELQQAQEQAQQAQKQVQQAQQGLDNASACLQALKVANFMPNLTDPGKAQADAQAKVDEIGKLAEQTADQTLRQNLLDVRGSVQQVASGQVSPATSAAWMQGQLNKYQVVAGTCSRINGG
jgi:hypothetical protein